MYTTEQDDSRYNILNVTKSEHAGGLIRFENATADQLAQLITEGFLDPQERQNNSPSTLEFIIFMTEWPEQNVRAHGYIVDNARPDRRITIEGLTNEKLSTDFLFLTAWYNFAHTADELDEYRSWWD